MHKFILSIADDSISDLIEHILEQSRPGEYGVLKAASLTEAYAWLAITQPSMIHLVICGLSESQNTAFVSQLKKTDTRNDYSIAIMDFAANAVPQSLDLHTDGILIQPFGEKHLLHVLDAFEPTFATSYQLV